MRRLGPGEEHVCSSFKRNGWRCSNRATHLDEVDRHRRWYCGECLHRRMWGTLTCIWSASCKEPVVAVVNGAPLCEAHREMELQRGRWSA